MNKMKRPIKRVMFYLMCGFVMTWIVAWSCSFIPHRHHFYIRYKINIYLGWMPIGANESVYSIAYRNFGIYEQQHYISSYMGFSTNDQNSNTSPLPLSISINYSPLVNPIMQKTANAFHEIYSRDQFPYSDTYFSVIAYGFPFSSHLVTGALSKSQRLPDGTLLQEINGAFSKPSPVVILNNDYPLAHSVYLPYAPIWRGLLSNTLFYALIFFAFVSTKRAFRHARRLRKGKCPICAYDLKFDNTLGCPECGWRKELGAQA